MQQLELEEGMLLEEGSHYHVSPFSEEIFFTTKGKSETSMVGFIENEVCRYYIENIDNDRGEEVAKEFRDYFESLTKIPEEFEFLT